MSTNAISINTKKLTSPGSPPRLKPGRETAWKYSDERATVSYTPTHLLKEAFLRLYGEQLKALKTSAEDRADYEKKFKALGKTAADVVVAKDTLAASLVEERNAFREWQVASEAQSKALSRRQTKSAKKLADEAIKAQGQTFNLYRKAQKCHEEALKRMSETLEKQRNAIVAYEALAGRFQTLVLTRTDLKKTEAMQKQLKASPTHPVICSFEAHSLISYLNKCEVDRCAEGIQNHFEARIQLFVQQLLLCYRTGFNFSNVSCSDRAEAVVENGNKDQEYEAAHSSTLPRLLYKHNGKIYVLAGKTFFYHSWNATVMLPDSVNKVDTKLDCAKKLRDQAKEILTAVAKTNQGKSFLEGLKLFLDEAKKRLKEIKEEQVGKQAPASLVADHYLSVVAAYRQGLETQPQQWINKLCFQKGELGKAYYLFVRNTMHGLVSVQAALLPQPAPALALTIGDHEVQLELTPTIKGYVQILLQDESAVDKGKEYDGDATSDCEALKACSGLKTIEKSKAASKAIKELAKKVQQVLVAAVKKNPRNLGTITLYFLTKV